MDALKRLILPALLGLALYFAVFGGEYSVFELRRARAEMRAAADSLARLERDLDSLRAWRDSLEHDPATLERVARERYGMIRDGEVLYRFT
ncbi:MAG: septum formation initiator family protein, partial [Gemmatimonadetes bacterium]